MVVATRALVNYQYFHSVNFQQKWAFLNFFESWGKGGTPKSQSVNLPKKNKKDNLQVRLLLAETIPWSPGHWTPSPPGEPHGHYGDGDGLVDGEHHGDYDEDAADNDVDGNVS